LVRAGGWRRDRFLRGGLPKYGRLWERSEIGELKLDFSRQSLDFLMWVTAYKPGAGQPTWHAAAKELRTADHLLLFLAYESVRIDTEIATAFRSMPAFAGNALIWLAYPDDFAAVVPGPVPDFASWLTGPGALILEALQPMLLSRWLHIERSKGQIGDWQRMLHEGRAEQLVLETFTEAAEQAGRPDLCRFLLQTLAQVLATPDLAPTFWTGGLQGNGPPRLGERLDTQRSALALLRQVERFRRWEQRARRAGWDDEGRDVHKFWLSEWQTLGMPEHVAAAGGEAEESPPLGEIISQRAERILHQIEPLRVGGD
jgi:hypothetical protein